MTNPVSPISRSAFVRVGTTVLVSIGGIGGFFWFIGNISFLVFQREYGLYGLAAFPEGFWKDILITFIVDALKCYGRPLPLISAIAIVFVASIYLKYGARLPREHGRVMRLIAGICGYLWLFLVLWMSLDLANVQLVPRRLNWEVVSYGRFLLYGIMIPTLFVIALLLSHRSTGQRLAYLFAPRNLVFLVVFCLVLLLIPYVYGKTVFGIGVFEVHFVKQGTEVHNQAQQQGDAISGIFYLGYAKDRQMFLQYPPTPASIYFLDSANTPQFSLRYVRNPISIRSLLGPPTRPDLKDVLGSDKVEDATGLESLTWGGTEQSYVDLLIPTGAKQLPLSDEERKQWTSE